MVIVVQTVHVWVVPHLAPSERRVAVTLQTDAVDGEFRQQVTLRRTALDGYLRKVLVEEYLLDLRIGVEGHLDDFCLTIWVGREIHDLRAWGA